MPVGRLLDQFRMLSEKENQETNFRSGSVTNLYIPVKWSASPSLVIGSLCTFVWCRTHLCDTEEFLCIRF